MDQLNLNMRLHRWLDVTNDYNFQILYRPRKANVVADTLSRKEGAPIRDLCLHMIVVTLLFQQIRKSHVEAMNEEHQKCERIMGQVSFFDYESRVLLNSHRRIWIPYVGETQQVLMEDAYKSRFSIHPSVTISDLTIVSPPRSMMWLCMWTGD